MNFDQVFQAFSKFGRKTSDGKSISLLQVNQWMRQAGVISGKFFSTGDTAVTFKKFKKKKMDQQTFEAFLKLLCKPKQVDVHTIKRKLTKAGAPGVFKTTLEENDLAGGARLSDSARPSPVYRNMFRSLVRRAIAGVSDNNQAITYVNKNTEDIEQ